MAGIVTYLRRLKHGCLDALSSRFTRWTKPLRTSLPLATLADLDRSKPELIAENALLRQQLIILRRQVKRPACTKTDRLLLVLLARIVRTWKQTLDGVVQIVSDPGVQHLSQRDGTQRGMLFRPAQVVIRHLFERDKAFLPSACERRQKLFGSQ